MREKPEGRNRETGQLKKGTRRLGGVERRDFKREEHEGWSRETELLEKLLETRDFGREEQEGWSRKPGLLEERTLRLGVQRGGAFGERNRKAGVERPDF